MKIFKTAILLSLILINSACEEVIDIDLNSSSPVVIAEGRVENNLSAWLKLSYSSDYFDPKESVKIEDAVVTLSNENGFIENLVYTDNGIYLGKEIIIKEHTYKLEFEYMGEVYSASTYINNPSEVLDVQFQEMEMKRNGEADLYSPRILFRDEMGIHNYYMIKFWANNIPENERYYLVDDDAYVDKGIIDYEPMMLGFENYSEVKIELYSIDEDTYLYYSQLNDSNGDMMGGSSTPYNPKSNFGSDILGFFAGWSVASYITYVEI